MCGLCGAFGGESHWSTTHTLDPEQAADERRRERAYRIALINSVLTSVRVTVQDFQNSSYLVSTATGKQALVNDLGGIWGAVMELTGQGVDPLSSQFIGEEAVNDQAGH